MDIRGGFLRSRKKGSCMLGWQAVGWLIQDNDARWTAAREERRVASCSQRLSVLGIIRGGN